MTDDQLQQVDIGGAVDDDIQKFKRLQNQDTSSISFGMVLEGIFWTLGALTVAGMLGSMFFVGADKPISGHAWLGYSLLGILLFGGLGFGTRIVRNTVSIESNTKKRYRNTKPGR